MMTVAYRGLALAAMLAAIGVSAAHAQQAAPQYYGHPSAQVAPSGQAGYVCQPGVACQPTKYGCVVTVCPCPCTASNACQVINSQIPPIHPVPTCQEPNVCTIIDEGPPTTQPQNITINRNCYVPIKVVTQPGPSNVTPVNINVNWREVHVLCGPDGKPLSSQQAAAVLQQLNAQAVATGTPPAAPNAPAAPPTSAPAPATPSVSAPAAPTASAPVEKGQEKHWVWLTDQNLYGYGYPRADGYWVIDEASKRQTLPQGATAVNVRPSGGALATASN